MFAGWMADLFVRWSVWLLTARRVGRGDPHQRPHPQEPQDAEEREAVDSFSYEIFFHYRRTNFTCIADGIRDVVTKANEARSLCVCVLRLSRGETRFVDLITSLVIKYINLVL